MKIASLLPCFVAVSFAVGCAAAPVDVDENTDVTREASTLDDPCATSGANAVVDISKPHTQGSYYRSSAYIDSICPAAKSDRPVTIVEFDFAAPSKNYNYTINIQPDFRNDPPQDPISCAEAEWAWSYWYDVGGGVWQEFEHGSTNGSWDVDPKTFQGKCVGLEIWGEGWGSRSNPYGIDNQTATRVRVHAVLTKADGTHASMQILGYNDGV